MRKKIHDCIQLTIISNQCCVLVILMQEIYPDGKGTECNFHRFEHGMNLEVFGMGLTGLNDLQIIISQKHKCSFIL